MLHPHLPTSQLALCDVAAATHWQGPARPRERVSHPSTMPARIAVIYYSVSTWGCARPLTMPWLASGAPLARVVLVSHLQDAPRIPCSLPTTGARPHPQDGPREPRVAASKGCRRRRAHRGNRSLRACRRAPPPAEGVRGHQLRAGLRGRAAPGMPCPSPAEPLHQRAAPPLRCHCQEPGSHATAYPHPLAHRRWPRRCRPRCWRR